MSLRGRQSTAHEYDKNNACIHCGMYKVNVEALSHECKTKREEVADWLEAEHAAKEANDHGE